VDNFLDYVNAGRYHCTVINRADRGASGDPFVLQMGGFFTKTLLPPPMVGGFMEIETFDPVPGVPAATIPGLTNNVGTVALALPGDGMGGTDEDAGTSSFFINLDDNSFLDADFTVFAVVPDLTTVNEIMNLNRVDLTANPDFGASPGNLAFTDVPLLDDGNLVFIQRAFVLEDTIAIAAARNGALAALNNPSSLSSMLSSASSPLSLASASSSPLSANLAQLTAASSQTAAVPEPGSLVTLLVGLSCLACSKRWGRSFRP
jgi:cyclophilin family peptidyl-prolyl cis-trans isomerase